MQIYYGTNGYSIPCCLHHVGIKSLSQSTRFIILILILHLWQFFYSRLSMAYHFNKLDECCLMVV